MDVLGLTNSFLSVTGSRERAIIRIADKRINVDNYINTKSPVSPGSTSALGGGMVPTGKVASLAKKAAKTALSTVGAGGIVDTISGALESVSGEYNKAFTVQFNPSTLNISGFSGGSFEIMDFSSPGKSAKTTPLEPNIALNVTLIFDQTELANSFPMDSLDYSISSVASKAMKGITAGMESFPISVQAVTEGFIGILSNPYTRLICFEWGNLRYKGVLKNISANYKLFDIMGRPVRSEVALSMYIADQHVKAAGGDASLGQWEEAYDAAFDDATVFGTTVADKVKKYSDMLMG